ncbi:MAG: hypothetical protein JSS68_14975 [Actinobacteria bacterium]|nr:hypothetical protein [Actinomycetota bacterium]
MNLAVLAQARAANSKPQNPTRKPVVKLAPAVPVGTGGSEPHNNQPNAPGKPATPKPPAPPKPAYNPLKVLEGLKTGELLTPQQMTAASKALAVLETRPEIHGYKEIATQLGNEKAATDKGLEQLRNRTIGQVGNVYKGIAQTEAESLARQQALSSQLGQQTAQIGQTSANALATMQQGAIGALNQNIALRGGEAGGGSAQQQLAAAVAGQREAQATDAQAAQDFALSQGATTQGLLAGVAASEQARGGETAGQIGRDVASRQSESDLKYGESQRTALNKLAEAKASVGPKEVKDMLELRANEQKYGLGKAAVAGEKAKLAQGAEELGLKGEELQVEREQNAIQNKIDQQKANASTTSAAASAENAATDAWKARHPAATAKEVEKAQKYIGEVKAYLPSAVSTYGPPKNPKQLNQFIGAVNKEVSAPPQIVRSVLERWFAKRSKIEAVKNAAKAVTGGL